MACLAARRVPGPRWRCWTHYSRIWVRGGGDPPGVFLKTFSVNLSSPTGATIAGGPGLGTILDPNALPAVLASPASDHVTGQYLAANSLPDSRRYTASWSILPPARNKAAPASADPSQSSAGTHGRPITVAPSSISP